MARQVQVLTEQLQATRTRLGHAELVSGEASRMAQARQEEAAGLRRALDTAEAMLAQLRADLAASKRAWEELGQRRPPSREADGTRRYDHAPRGRPASRLNQACPRSGACQ